MLVRLTFGAACLHLYPFKVQPSDSSRKLTYKSIAHTIGVDLIPLRMVAARWLACQLEASECERCARVFPGGSEKRPGLCLYVCVYIYI